jgi:hypothetical protein
MLIDQIDFGSGFVNSNARVTNTSGTLINSFTDPQDGQAIADEYTLTLSGVSGGTGTITVDTLSDTNPYKGLVKTLVPLDSTTARKDIVPGLSIIFQSGASNGNTASVKVGVFGGEYLNDSSTQSSGTRHRVYNNGINPVSSVLVRLITQAVRVKPVANAQDLVFFETKEFADGATEKADVDGKIGAYVFAISNVSGSGAGKTADLSLDGASISGILEDLVDSSTVSGVGLKADGINPYKFLSGPLTGFEFMLSPDCVNGATSRVLIFSSRFVQIAPDVAGVAGTYGLVDVDLGEIAAGGYGYYWTRYNISIASNAVSNPHPSNVAIQGTEAEGDSADWLV